MHTVIFAESAQHLDILVTKQILPDFCLHTTCYILAKSVHTASVAGDFQNCPCHKHAFLKMRFLHKLCL